MWAGLDLGPLPGEPGHTMWNSPVGDSVKCPTAQPWVLSGHPWAQCRGCAHNRELLPHPGGHWDPQPPPGPPPTMGC